MLLFHRSFRFSNGKGVLFSLFVLFQRYRWYILIIVLVVLFHLLEVGFVDPYMTSLIGYDYAYNISFIEDGYVASISRYWTPILLCFFVFIYIILYPFLLWFTPLYCILSDNRIALRLFTYGLLLIYIIALPFYLLLPISNVYTFHGLPSPLGMVIPGCDYFFYTTTTSDNCFPSLHVALSILVFNTSLILGNKGYRYLCSICMILVVVSVLYLCIHWVIDVLGGIVVSLLVVRFMKHYKPFMV